MSIKKRPGADWEVVYQDSDGSYGRAVIFGLNDFSQLETELVSALPDEADVVRIKRLGFEELKARRAKRWAELSHFLAWLKKKELDAAMADLEADFLADAEVIAKAIEIIEREVIGEGCKTPDYEDFREDPEIRITPDINDPARCYACAGAQVVRWLRDYLALPDEAAP